MALGLVLAEGRFTVYARWHSFVYDRYFRQQAQDIRIGDA